MRGFILAIVAICAAVLLELIVPGRGFYHWAWYNVALLALAAGAALAVKSLAVRSPFRTPSLTLLALGGAIVALAGVTNGLLAPDDATVIAAPGATVPVDDLNATLSFSLDGRGATLTRGRSSLAIPASGTRLSGSFILHAVLRTEVAVAAYDLAGGHLTITQPNGTVFLSPVLTMQQLQPISGVPLPFDTFAVPAQHRIVHVFLFDPQQAAALLRGFDSGGRDAVLFAVDDDADRPAANGIAVARDGATVTAGGLRLRAVTAPYPAVAISAVPMPTVVALGLLVVGLGALWPLAAKRNRRKPPLDRMLPQD